MVIQIVFAYTNVIYDDIIDIFKKNLYNSPLRGQKAAVPVLRSDPTSKSLLKCCYTRYHINPPDPRLVTHYRPMGDLLLWHNIVVLNT